MTCWKPGMLAVCINTDIIKCGDPKCGCVYDGREAPALNSISRVIGMYIEHQCGGLPLILRFDGGRIGYAGRFRPAVEDRDRCEDEFITLLKRSKPAPAQPHKADVQVGVTCEHKAPTSASDAVTHRDLSQHADSYLTNGFEIVPHAEDL